MTKKTPLSIRTLASVLAEVNQLSDWSDRPASHANDQCFPGGDFPLHKVAIWGDVEAAAMLLAHNADVNAQGEDGDTALHRARGDIEMVKLLLSRGAHGAIVNRYGDKALTDDAVEQVTLARR